MTKQERYIQENDAITETEYRLVKALSYIASRNVTYYTWLFNNIEELYADTQRFIKEELDNEENN